MRRQIIFGTLIILAIGGIVAAGIWGPDRDWDRNDRVEIVRVADDGTVADGSAAPGDVIVVEGQRPFFFPFGLLIVPLGFFLLFGLFRGAFFRGGPRGGNPAWLEDWHRRQHQTDQVDRQPGDTTPDRQA